MLHTIRAQCVLFNANTIERDAVMNTFHFGTDELDPFSVLGDLTTALDAFYSLLTGHLSPALSGTGEVTYYLLDQAPPRIPMQTDALTIGDPDGQPIPNECAIVLSYRAAPQAGINPARRRGRLYLGPWSDSAVDNSTGGAIVAAATVATITNAADNLRTDAAVANAPWVVFSPTTAGPEPWSQTALDSSTFEVQDGYVDNAWDTQRRRGIAATTRTVWP